MYNGVDSRSPELTPKRDNNPPIAFFFVAFEVVGNFFILNLFIGRAPYTSLTLFR